MEVLYPRCAGLDVHKDTVVACARLADGDRVTQEVQSFDTSSKGLLALADWLADQGCTHVAMEATGVYWKPVWHILEGSFELVLANAAHIRNVPGRKTDVNDATWIADLLAHGLIRGSFVPERPIQELRALTRTRKQWVREKASHVRRIHKTLEDANLKLGSVASDIMGKSGREVLAALIKGQTDPERLADATKGRLRAPRHAIVEALRGNVTTNHRFLLKLHLGQIRGLDRAIAQIDRRVGALLDPFRAAASKLTTIPGVSDVVAQVIVSEIGVDMSRFPTDGHLVSWAGLCPRNDESAGKRRSTRLRPGDPWLKTALIQAAWSAVRAKPNYLRAQFFRLKSRRGPNKAIVAVAASMLTATYYILRDQVEYRDLGASYFDRLDGNKRLRRLVSQIQNLGYHVELEKIA